MEQVDETVQRIARLAARLSTILVAIDGCGGAGKTTLAKILSRALDNAGIRCGVVHFDDFYLPYAHRSTGCNEEFPVGANFDWRRLREQVLLPLRAGRDAIYSRYDWEMKAMAEDQFVSASATVIVEGVYSYRKELESLYDLSIWVDCPRNIRLTRGIERDGEDRRAQWQYDWMPAEDRYVEVHRPHERADMVVSGSV